MPKTPEEFMTLMREGFDRDVAPSIPETASQAEREFAFTLYSSGWIAGYIYGGNAVFDKVKADHATNQQIHLAAAMVRRTGVATG